MKRAALLIIIVLIVLAGVLLSGYLFLFRPYSNEIERIDIAAMPYKLSYFVEETLDLEGLQVRGIQRNGSLVELKNDDFIITGFTSETPDDHVIVYLQYKSFSVFFVVEVLPLPEETAHITSIEMYSLPNRMTYDLSESIDLTGAVIKINYSNDTFRLVNVIKPYVFGFDTSLPNERQIITVRYHDYEQGRDFETHFEITVLDPL